MLVATASVGDQLVTLCRVQGIANTNEFTYNLTITDLPTDKSYTHSIVGENDALHAFAAWIAADDGEGFPTIAKMLAELRDSPAHRFLP